MLNLLVRRPILTLFIVLGLALMAQATYLDAQGFSLSTFRTWQAYLVNFCLASIIIFILGRLPERMEGNEGFVFMIGSAVKFTFFFIFFYPFFKEDGEIQKIEFASFFLPYAISLSIKTLLLLVKLNKA
jgi:hypothetical protein